MSKQYDAILQRISQALENSASSYQSLYTQTIEQARTDLANVQIAAKPAAAGKTKRTTGTASKTTGTKVATTDTTTLQATPEILAVAAGAVSAISAVKLAQERLNALQQNQTIMVKFFDTYRTMLKKAMA
jgi:hypothetical protein